VRIHHDYPTLFLTPPIPQSIALWKNAQKHGTKRAMQTKKAMRSLTELASQEWLLTNGMGGFASGTVAGCATRRYHSLLTMALDPPSGRRMSLLGGIDETVIFGGVEYPLATHLYEDGSVFPGGWQRIESFLSNRTRCHWRFTGPEWAVTKQLTVRPGKNTLCTEYYFEDDDSNNHQQIRLAPLVCWKEIHAQMQPWDGFPYRSEPLEKNAGWLFQATDDAPIVRMYVLRGRGKWERAEWWNRNIAHPIEAERGFSATESLYCPATVLLENGGVLIVTLDAEEQAQSPLPDTEKSVFLVGGQKDIRATILAGYPWFTDWGRDAFISLPGLCLSSNRLELARRIVRDFVPWISKGRIPNRFPDNTDTPAYNNVDGTLWFVRCIGLCGLESELKEPLAQIIAAHKNNTVGDGIYCDTDGLLRCGDSHTNLTWMDAKVNGVAITPRFDRPVEVQALWINALQIAGETALARKATEAFLTKFVRPDGLGLFDCLLPDGTPDPSIRPNQVIAAALLELPDDINAAVFQCATEQLLTPYGLRTLAPTDPKFCPRYEGGPEARDGAYHQGTVWPWLIGSYLDLYKKVNGSKSSAEIDALLAPLQAHLEDDYGLGGIAEVFDATEPYRPNGCPWQAWSIAEVLRHA
jgi:glycogen debranching enzyme